MQRVQRPAAPQQRSKRTVVPRLISGRAALLSPVQHPEQPWMCCMVTTHHGTAQLGGGLMATQAAALRQLPRHEGLSGSQVTRRAGCHTTGRLLCKNDSPAARLDGSQQCTCAHSSLLLYAIGAGAIFFQCKKPALLVPVSVDATRTLSILRPWLSRLTDVKVPSMFQKHSALSFQQGNGSIEEVQILEVFAFILTAVMHMLIECIAEYQYCTWLQLAQILLMQSYQ